MYNENFRDTLAQLCFKHFHALPKTGKPKENEWTILSCIILQENDKLEVVALGTGTKCIGQDKMSKDGDILNDSHAEVICRRAFIRFIYENILQRNGFFTFISEQQKFELKSGIKFHFFSTQVPCGDAAIFPKQDSEDFGDLLSEQSSCKRTCSESEVPAKKMKTGGDIFRTGAKCLNSDTNQDLKVQGVDFHVTGVVRTKPGRGTPTLSVSCSDKIAKWCHLGLQGALLSVLLKEPVYFSSFTVSGGTPYDEDAMRRALFVRLEQQCNVSLGQAKLGFSSCKSKSKLPCPASIIWLKGNNLERKIEVAIDGRRQGVTKSKLKSSGALQICKKEFFGKFVQIVKQFEIQLNVDFLDQLTYKEAKMCAQNYQKSWALLQSHFKVWPKKDETLLNFQNVCNVQK